MSNIVYHRKSTTLRDSIVCQNGDGTFVTGLVNADWTKKLSKDGTGNQSTAGITVTEVDSVNNPGEYTVVAASSAFPAANGVYVLSLTRTASATFSFEQVYVVNDTGTSGSTPSSFSATAADGRVTDGSSPLTGATVYLTLGSTFYTQTTTDASGLWGPVYLVDGTFTVRVQLSGYTQGTGTITVSGGTVTGPGADIALTVSSTAGALSAAQLWAYARRQAVDLTGTKADAIIKGAVNDALDMVSSERLWPHLLRKGYLALHAPYSTGTITITNGAATITTVTGVWPSWAASGKIFVNNQIIDVATRTSDTVLTMADTWEAATITTATYVLYQNEYDLPDDLWRFHKNLPGQRWGWGAEPESPARLLEAEHAACYSQTFPDMFTVANGKFICWPYPSAAAMLAYTYYARPARLAVDTDEADWDPVHIESLKRAIDYQLARQVGKVLAGDAGTTMQAYKEAMGRLSAQDKSATDVAAPQHDMSIGMGRRHGMDWKRL
jgi:hypothetical protein